MSSGKLLILDLDETLIHATASPPNEDWHFEVDRYKVYERPDLRTFLNEVKTHFRIAVWSSASDDYVKEVVAKIFPEDYPLEFVWGRSRCTLQVDYDQVERTGYLDYNNHMNYVKQLKKVKRKGISTLEEMLIVDDTPHKSKYNYGNAIYPSEFNGDPKDTELLQLLKYLISIKDVSNFRDIEKRNWKSKINH